MTNKTKIKIAFAAIAAVAVYLIWSNYNNSKSVLNVAVSEDKKANNAVVTTEEEIH